MLIQPQVQTPATTTQAAPGQNAAPADHPSVSLVANPNSQPPPPEDKQPISRQLLALQKRERQLREREERVKSLEPKLQEYESALKEWGTKPTALLEKLGGPKAFDHIQKFILAGGEVSEEDKLKQDMLTLKEQIEEANKAREKEQAELQRAAAEQGRTHYKSASKVEAEKSPDKYELFLAHGEEATELAVQAFEAHHKRTGEVRTMAQILDAIESMYQSRADKLLTTKWAQSKLKQQPAAPPVSQLGNRAVPKTLTNAVAAEPSPATSRPSTEQERYEAAIEGLRRLRRG